MQWLAGDLVGRMSPPVGVRSGSLYRIQGLETFERNWKRIAIPANNRRKAVSV